MTIEVIGLEGLPELSPGDEIAALILRALDAQGLRLRDGDVVVVTQKAISKVEGRVVPVGPEGKRAWVERETVRVVARRGDLVIAETRHGFVCANAGVDESNVAAGFVTLLPEDPDASADGVRKRMEDATGARVGVVITDTFGRPWRNGVLDVAIGCAGIAPLNDLRGQNDARGRTLEATVIAVADQIAAAAGMVMGKSDGIPAAVVRGAPVELRDGSARELIRPREDDLFPYSPLG